jgi:NAD(P)H-dependent flavin oxidoreductase YrpB (nitropropane dioxygenase family)
MLKNDWTEAWATEGNPEPLGMPLQGMVTGDAIRRTHHYAGKGDCQKVAFNPVGQVVGQINSVESTRGVMERLLNEYADSVERVNGLFDE